MIYYKKRGLIPKLKRFISSLKPDTGFLDRDFSSKNKNVFKIFLSVLLFTSLFLYSAFLFLAPKFLNEDNIEAFLNSNLEKNSKLTLDIENIDVSADFKFNIVVKADKIKLKYSKNNDFLILDNANININPLTLLNGYLDLNKIKIKNITINTDFTTQNKYSAFSYFDIENINLNFGKFKPKLRNINILADNVTVKINDKNINKTFYIFSKNVKLLSNSFINNTIVISGKGNIKSSTIKLADYILNIEIKLKDFNPKILNKKLSNLNYNPFLYADKFKFYSKNNVNLKINLKDDRTNVTGKIAINDFSFSYENIKLPKNNFLLYFKGDKISTDCDFKLFNDKFIKIKGIISPYKNKYIELKINSNKIDLAELNNVLVPMAKIFNLKIAKNEIQLQGSMLVNLYLKSNFKKITSNGKLEINNAKLDHKTLGLVLENINSNVNFNNNEINILNSSFNVEKEKFYLKGKINSDSTMDLNISSGQIKADKAIYLIKSLPLASHLLSVASDNYNVKSGILNIKAQIKGNIKKPILNINSSLNNLKVHLKNQNSNLTIQNILISSYNSPDINLIVKNLLFETTLNSKKIKIKAPVANTKITSKDITLSKTKISIDNMGADFDFKIKNYNSKAPETSFNLVTDNLNSNNIIKVKNSAIKLLLSGIIRQNKFIITDCRLFNPQANLALIKGNISNFNSKNPYCDLKVIIDNKISLIIPFVQNLSFDIIGHIDIVGKISSLDIFGDLVLKNILYPDYKLKISDLILNIKNSNIYFNIQNLDINTEKFDINGLLKYQKDKILFHTVNISASYLDYSNLEYYLSELNNKKRNNKNIEITKLNFNVASLNVFNAILNNVSITGSLKNNILILNQVKTELCKGTITGSVAYNLENNKVKTDLILRDINVRLLENIIKEIKPLSFATSGKLSGLLSIDFIYTNTKELLKTLNGYIKFSIKDGELDQFAKLERFLQAGNIISQSFLKLSLNSVISTVTKQNTGDFKLLEGSIIVKNSIADIKYIKSQGTNMSLYATGKFNLETEISNIRILGRVPSSIVSVMGRIGNFTTQKLVDKLSDDTKDIINSLSISPFEKMLSTVIPNEELIKIPQLVNGDLKSTRCFIVIVQGLIQNTSSIKTFKWNLSE